MSTTTNVTLTFSAAEPNTTIIASTVGIPPVMTAVPVGGGTIQHPITLDKTELLGLSAASGSASLVSYTVGGKTYSQGAKITTTGVYGPITIYVKASDVDPAATPPAGPVTPEQPGTGGGGLTEQRVIEIATIAAAKIIYERLKDGTPPAGTPTGQAPAATSGNVYPIEMFMAAGETDVGLAINRAQSAITEHGHFGTLLFKAGVTYTQSTPVQHDVGHVSIRGDRTTIDYRGIPAPTGGSDTSAIDLANAATLVVGKDGNGAEWPVKRDGGRLSFPKGAQVGWPVSIPPGATFTANVKPGGSGTAKLGLFTWVGGGQQGDLIDAPAGKATVYTFKNDGGTAKTAFFVISAWDPATTIEGVTASSDKISAPSVAAWHVHARTGPQYGHETGFFEGITFVGDRSKSGVTGMLFKTDKPTNTDYSVRGVFSQCRWVDTDIGVAFADNAFCQTFIGCFFNGCGTNIQIRGGDNSGELNTWIGLTSCNANLHIDGTGGGEHAFIGCRFDYSDKLIHNGTGEYLFTDCHFECDFPPAEFIHLDGGEVMMSEGSQLMFADSKPVGKSPLIKFGNRGGRVTLPGRTRRVEMTLQAGEGEVRQRSYKPAPNAPINPATPPEKAA